MLILGYGQAKKSIAIKFFFEKRGYHQRMEAYYQNGYTLKNFEHNQEPLSVIQHVPQECYLACYMHWIGTDRPQQIAIFDKETKEEIHKFFTARRKENAGIAWYYVPKARYEILKKELEDMQKKAQDEKIRLARAREQQQRTAKLAKQIKESDKLLVNTDDEFEEKETKGCCSCWWR